MFRMLGKEVQLFRYKILWQEDKLDFEEKCVSEEHKEVIEQTLSEKNVNYSIEEINQTSNEWVNGLHFDSYDLALNTLLKGEEAYIQEKQRLELVDNLRLRADIDYLSIMSGVEI